MINRIRITTLLVVIIALLFSASAVAQKATNPSEKAVETEILLATISNDFMIQLPDEPGKFSAVYLLDIKNIPFKSEEGFNRFCNAFSIDFQVLKGDFKRQQITLILDSETIERKGYSKEQISRHFSEMSRRMNAYFKKFNN